MSRLFALRLLESFFRHKLLCLLPLLLLCGIGVVSARDQEELYRSEGVMYVESEALLSNLENPGGGGSTAVTPAQVTAERLGDLLQTDDFLDAILERAGLRDAVSLGLVTPATARSSITVSARGNNLLRIASEHAEPEVAFKLATSTIDEFIDYVITAILRESDAERVFYEGTAATYKTNLDAAIEARAQYLAQFPDPPVNVARPTAQVIAIAQLNDAVDSERARYQATLAKAEEARLQGERTRTEVERRLRAVDVPELPTGFTSSRKDQVLEFGLFALLGLVLSAAAVVVGALTDRSIRHPVELSARLGVPMLAMLPDGGPPPPRGMRMASLIGAGSLPALTEARRGYEDHHDEP